MMAADPNLSQTQVAVPSHLTCNVRQSCSNNEDNINSINVNITVKTQNQEQEHAHECRSEDTGVKTQYKENKTNDSQGYPCTLPVSPTNSNKETPKPSIFNEGSTSGAVKKTLVKEEDQTRERVQSSATQHNRRKDQGILNSNESRRKLERHFKRVDAHAISAGQELKSKRIFSVQTIAKAITTELSTDLERLRAIWIWICHNIDYDLSGYLGLTEEVFSPERVIETGRGVCAGYSSVCLQLCRAVGIECREVEGHGKGKDKGVGYKLDQSCQNIKPNHMWNAVRLEDHWYLLDACWGAGIVEMDNKSYIKRYDEFYFLTDPKDFVNSHWPEEEKWQLLDQPVTLEEFKKSVFKTSEFYKLGLTLIHPEQYLLVTENGEASISIRLSQTVDFIYKIYQHQNGEQKELSNSMGLLTVTQNIMKLVLIPPMAGTFEIMLFAQKRNGSTSAKFSWVCSFLLECDKPKTTQNLPENPHLFWGITQIAEDLGLSPCIYGHEAILVKSGSYELVLHTRRPLMMLCEISHKDLDATLAKRCLATQIEADKLTCSILCPYIGYYRLSVFVRDYENDSHSFQNVGNFLLDCTANPVNLNQLFPSDLSHFCGPGIRTDSAGLSKFSHTVAIVSTQQGMFNITFQNQHDLDLHAILKHSKEQSGLVPLSRHVFFTYEGSKVTLSLTLPAPGVYKLSLFGKTPSTQEFNLLCDFILQNNSESPGFPFPYTYTAWRKGSVLFEPRSGLLKPLCCVQFRVLVPGARRVIVLGESIVHLQIDESRTWKGEVFTGNMEQIKLAASPDETSDQMDILMTFNVLGSQNGMIEKNFFVEPHR